MFFCRNFLVFLFFLFALDNVQAAEIKRVPVAGTDIPMISLRGEIVEGDALKFEQAVEGLDRAAIELDSRGGLVGEALEIGATIRSGGFGTFVSEDEECLSACGLIWVSGTMRFMTNRSLIGFHAAYVKENGEYRESGVANAEIGSFLTHLGLRIEAIRYFTTAGPNDFLPLTIDRARALGIEVLEVNDDKIVDPSAKPTVDILAERFVSYSFLQIKCRPYLAPDLTIIKDGQASAFNQGNTLVPNETWIKISIPFFDKVKSQAAEKGTLAACIDTEARLRDEHLPTGVNSPSFSCNIARTPTETALCRDAALWAKDRAISSIYVWIRNNVDDARRQQLLAGQRGWLRMRDQCGGDTICLTAVYDKRIFDLRKLDLPQ